MRDGLHDFFRALLLKVLASLTATLVIWLMKALMSLV